MSFIACSALWRDHLEGIVMSCDSERCISDRKWHRETSLKLRACLCPGKVLVLSVGVRIFHVSMTEDITMVGYDLV